MSVLFLLAHVLTGNAWVVTFSDEFPGNSLDTGKWGYMTGPDPTHSCSIYSRPEDTVTLSNGTLRIGLKNTPDNLGYYSGRLYSRETHGPFGYFEARIRVDSFSNMGWPAFWLLPRAGGKYGPWPRSGEIDVMESINNNGFNYMTLHCGGSSHDEPTAHDGISAGTPVGVDFSAFHTFGVNWQPTGMFFYLDYSMTGQDPDPSKAVGVVLNDDAEWRHCAAAVGRPSTSGAPFDSPMNIILDLAIGGDWAGSVANSKCKCQHQGSDDDCVGYGNCTAANCFGLNTNIAIEVDWVKVWEK